MGGMEGVTSGVLHLDVVMVSMLCAAVLALAMFAFRDACLEGNSTSRGGALALSVNSVGRLSGEGHPLSAVRCPLSAEDARLRDQSWLKLVLATASQDDYIKAELMNSCGDVSAKEFDVEELMRVELKPGAKM